MNLPSVLQSDKLNVSVAGINFQTWQVIAIVALLFLLVIVMASVRRHFLEFTVRGAGMGFLLGFLMALVIEGLLLVGGKTILTSTLGWKNPPKPISVVLEATKAEFLKVLGASDQGHEDITQSYNKLSVSEQESLKSILCTP